MATKTAKKTETAPVAIPAAGGKQASFSPGNILNRFKNAAAAAPKSAKKERPQLALTDEATEALKKFAPVKVLFDIVEACKDTTIADLKRLLRELYIKTLWQQKSQPENPALKANDEKGKVDIESMYVMTEKMKVNMPPMPDTKPGEPEVTPEEVLIEALQDAFEAVGVKKEDAVADATNLVTNEVDFTPSITIDFTALLVGQESTDLQKEVANKFLNWQAEGGDLELTDEERAGLPLKVKHQATVKDGFLERVASYAHCVEQIDVILSVIEPTPQIRGTKICVSDPGTKTDRLLEKATEILKGAK